MRPRSAIPIVLAALALTMIFTPSVAAASYTLTISPNTVVSLGTQMTMTIDISGGSKFTAYTLVFEIEKPNGTGTATTSRVLTTDNRGVASSTVPYPDPSFTATSGTVATDVGGVYNVIVNQTAPSNIAP